MYHGFNTSSVWRVQLIDDSRLENYAAVSYTFKNQECYAESKNCCHNDFLPYRSWHLLMNHLNEEIMVFQCCQEYRGGSWVLSWMVTSFGLHP